MNEPNGRRQDTFPLDDAALAQPAEPDTFPLDDAAIQFLAELDEQLRRAIDQLNSQANGMMTYFMKAHNLKGPWKLAPNRRELMLETPAPVAQPA